MLRLLEFNILCPLPLLNVLIIFTIQALISSNDALSNSLFLGEEGVNQAVKIFYNSLVFELLAGLI